MIKTETTEIEILGKKHEYFRSANSEKKFAQKAAEIAQKEDDDVGDLELIDYSAKLIHEGIKDASLNKSWLWRLLNPPPSAKMLMRSLKSSDLMELITGVNGKSEEDPNL